MTWLDNGEFDIIMVILIKQIVKFEIKFLSPVICITTEWISKHVQMSRVDEFFESKKI